MKAIYKALAEFQQSVPIIHKGAQGYNYTYADLPAIFEVINPLLKKHGLGFTQLVNKDCLKTIIFHIESGGVLESETELLKDVSLGKMNDFQVLGSQITYLRRYALSSALGLVTDVDNDAAGEQKSKVKTELIWLNKDTEQWEKAVIYLKDGNGTIKEIEKKYKLSKENKELLIDEAI